MKGLKQEGHPVTGLLVSIFCRHLDKHKINFLFIGQNIFIEVDFGRQQENKKNVLQEQELNHFYMKLGMFSKTLYSVDPFQCLL